jgi:hypothetical protein
MRPWRFATAAVAGVSHVRANLPCQDRVACQTIDGTLIAAAADGAGSAKHSDEGAELVVHTILESLRPSNSDAAEALAEQLRGAVCTAREAVLKLADERGIPAREFASTVLAVVATETAAACAHLGDGIIAVSDGAAEWSWVFWPERGEYANVTRFLTDPDALELLRSEGVGAAVTDFALLTDGLEPLAVVYASQTVHDPFFSALFAPLHRSDQAGEESALSASLADFLASAAVGARVDDDLSLVIATRRPFVPPPA